MDNSREQQYLAYLAGESSVYPQDPYTRTELYLYAMCKNGGGGGVTPEEIEKAVEEYLEEHPVQPTPIDDTLTQEGYAADARAVGDRLKDTITGITLNGDEVPVEDNIAELTIEAEAPIEHIAVNGEEQPIEDKTVDLSIDRASVDGETLVVGDTAGGGGQDSRIITGTIDSSGSVTIEGGLVMFYGDDTDDNLAAILCNAKGGQYQFINHANWTITRNGNQFTFSNYEGARYIAIIMEG